MEREELKEKLDELGITAEEYFEYKLDLEKNFKGYIKYVGRKIMMRCLIFIPILILFYIIGTHSNLLINNIIFTIVKVSLVILLLIFIVGLILYLKNIKIDIKSLINIKLTKVYILCMSIYAVVIATLLFIFYGPVHEFKEWIVKGTMVTEEHQYAKWIYSEKEIDSILNKKNK